MTFRDQARDRDLKVKSEARPRRDFQKCVSRQSRDPRPVSITPSLTTRIGEIQNKSVYAAFCLLIVRLELLLNAI